jgi:hypothetical protein
VSANSRFALHNEIPADGSDHHVELNPVMVIGGTRQRYALAAITCGPAIGAVEEELELQIRQSGASVSLSSIHVRAEVCEDGDILTVALFPASEPFLQELAHTEEADIFLGKRDGRGLSRRLSSENRANIDRFLRTIPASGASGGAGPVPLSARAAV